MKIQVLGGHGGLAQGFSTTSFLIDDKLLVDAGGVAATLSVEAQARIEYILITHCHLDHIKDLAFISDNCFGIRPNPFRVYTHPTVKSIIKSNLLNDIIWPDFTVLPSIERPTMTIDGVREEKEFQLGEYHITPVLVKHAHDAMGYIIEKGKVAILFTGDTGPTQRIWEVAQTKKNLSAIFTEVSFPNRLQQVADVSDHHTARSLSAEIKKMPTKVPIVLTHLKPGFREEIVEEINELREGRIRILEKDGDIFNY